VIIVVSALAAVVWILLAFAMLVAGLARFGRESHATASGGAWIGVWVAAVALMAWILAAPRSRNVPKTAAVRSGKPARNSSHRRARFVRSRGPTGGADGHAGQPRTRPDSRQG
jgi:hypothetical protein